MADYAGICERLDDRADVEAIELNLSCPNVEEAPETAAQIVAGCRARTSKPLYAKLSPATWDIAESARAVVAAGADGLSLVNTIRGMALDPATLRPKLGRGTGGYSGTGAETDRARVHLRLCQSGRRPDRRDGRRRLRARCSGARRGGRIRCLTGHHPVRRSRLLRRAFAGSSSPKPRHAVSQIRSMRGELPMVNCKKSLQIGENGSA